MAFKVTAFAGAFFALSLASGLAQAQTSQAPHSPRASLERLKLAKAVIEAQGGAKNISAMLDGIMKNSVWNIPGSSDAAKANQAKAREITQQTMNEFLPRIIDAEAEAFAETFDEHQLSDILTFYQSPTGQAMRDKLPELGARTGAATSKIMPAFVAELLDRLCSQTTCTAQQQQTLAALKRQPASAPAP